MADGPDKIFGLAGWSGSGKTTLVVRLIPVLTGRGLTVSTMKHAHHAFEPDQEGKDSYEHRHAGACEVMVGSARRWALMHELREAPEPSMEELVARMSPVDLLLVEGFKRAQNEKLEVYRQANGKPFLYPDDPQIVAVASDAPIDSLRLPRLDLDDVDGIADFIMTHCGLTARSRGAA